MGEDCYKRIILLGMFCQDNTPRLSIQRATRGTSREFEIEKKGNSLNMTCTVGVRLGVLSTRYENNSGHSPRITMECTVSMCITTYQFYPTSDDKKNGRLGVVARASRGSNQIRGIYTYFQINPKREKLASKSQTSIEADQKEDREDHNLSLSLYTI